MPQPDRNVLDQSLGLAIRSRRRQVGVSQAALADSLGVPFDQIQRYERGLDRINFSRLVAIAQALGCRIADLVGDLDSTAANGSPARDPRDDADARELLAAFTASPPHIRRAALRLLVELARDASPADGARSPLQ